MPVWAAGRAVVIAAVCLAMAVAWTGDAAAEVDELEVFTIKGRIDRLEQDVDRLRRGQPAPATTTSQQQPPAFAVLDSRLATLEQEVRNLTGRLEQLEFQSRKNEQDLQTMKSDLEFRLSRLEGTDPSQPPPPPNAAAPGQEVPSAPAADAQTAASAGSGPRVLGQIPADDQAARSASPDTPPAAAGGNVAAAAGAGAVAAPAALPAGTPREQYAYAFDLLRKAQYPEAEQAFSAYVAAHPDNPLTDNARYWLAETYYVRGDNARAAQGFLASYEANKTGQKAPDSLLKLGMALTNLDKTSEACATFSELRRAFPDATPTVLDKVAQERRRAGCG